MDTHSLSLVSRFSQVVQDERRLLVESIRILIEMEDLRLHLELGYSSVFLFLTEHFGLSNASAYRRHMAAKLTRRMPEVLEWLEAGVSLKKLSMLEEVLTPASCGELLGRAKKLSENEVSELAASMMPGEPVTIRKATIRPVPRKAIAKTAAALPDWFATYPQIASAAEVPTPSAPPAPTLHLLQMTVGPEFLETLERVRSALSHTHPGASVEELLLACMRTTALRHERTRCAKVERPRAPKPSKKNGRYVPAAVRREVWDRDQGRCTFVGVDGKRCNATFQLEEHHIIPFATGGETSAGNLTLHCRPHNDLEARRAFGDAFMDGVRPP